MNHFGICPTDNIQITNTNQEKTGRKYNSPTYFQP